MRLMPTAFALLLIGCYSGPADGWANREQIVAAALRCGVTDFEPTEAGANYAAYVPRSVPNAQAKEDCIYRDLHRQGLLITR